MERYIPVEKLSKRAKRELNQARRGSWGGVNPVTRRPPNPKAYNRKKARQEERSLDAVPFYLLSAGCPAPASGTKAACPA